MITPKQPSFTGGEISPSLQSRTDLDRYYVSLAEAYNVFIHVHGGVSNLAGTKHIGAVNDSSYRSRLVPFEFNTTQTYIIEFSHEKVRIIKDGGLVLSGGSPYNIASPYKASELAELNFVQSADVLYICHPLYAPRTLSRSAHDNWTFNTIDFTNNPFSAANKYPRASTFYEQRQVFGGTNEKRDSSFYSKIGAFTDMSVSSPMEADDAILDVVIPSQKVNEIRHYVPLTDLIVFTSGSEFKVSSGDSAFTFETIRQKPQTLYGSSIVSPLVIGNEVLFIQARGSLVRSLGYSLEVDNYKSSDLTLLAPHLFEGYTIKEWCYAQIPHSVIFCVRDDGKLLILTYLPEQQIWGWSWGDTKGEYESVATVPEGGEDAVYFTVKRRINGSVVRHIERLNTRLFRDVRDCFFVHDGLSYDMPKVITSITNAEPCVIGCVGHGFDNGDEVDIFDAIPELNTRRFLVSNKTDDNFEITDLNGNDIDSTDFTKYFEGGNVRKAVDTVSGLNHLEGEEVSCLCDGSYEQNKVEAGAVSFTRKFSRIHIGIPYISRIKTLPVEFGRGELNAKKRRISAVNIQMEKTRGLKVGTGSANWLLEMKDREFELMGDPTKLFTGEKKITVSTTWDKQGQVIIQQDFPLPMNITAVLPEVQVGG